MFSIFNWNFIAVVLFVPFFLSMCSTVFDAYRRLSGCDIEDSIEGETTGNLENLLLAVGKTWPQSSSRFKTLKHFGSTEQCHILPINQIRKILIFLARTKLF